MISEALIKAITQTCIPRVSEWRIKSMKTGDGVLKAAYQFGSSNKGPEGGREDVCCIRCKYRLAVFCQRPANNNFRLQYEFLSGDDPGSDNYEGFDTMWGRWARLSDIFADAMRRAEGRAADYTNLHRIGPGWSFNPSDKITLATDYYLLFADESQGSVGMPQGTSDSGLFRGQLLTSVLSYKFNKYISGHLQGEFFSPAITIQTAIMTWQPMHVINSY